MSYRCDLCFTNDFTNQGCLIRKYASFKTKQHYIRHLKTPKHTKNINYYSNLTDYFECPACSIKLDSDGWKNHYKNNKLIIAEANCELDIDNNDTSVKQWCKSNPRCIEDIGHLMNDEVISCNNYTIAGRQGRWNNYQDWWTEYSKPKPKR